MARLVLSALPSAVEAPQFQSLNCPFPGQPRPLFQSNIKSALSVFELASDVPRILPAKQVCHHVLPQMFFKIPDEYSGVFRSRRNGYDRTKTHISHKSSLHKNRSQNNARMNYKFKYNEVFQSKNKHINKIQRKYYALIRIQHFRVVLLWESNQRLSGDGDRVTLTIPSPKSSHKQG